MPSGDTHPSAQPVRDRVELVIAEIRPAIQQDGGDVELVEVTASGEVRLRFKGACLDCPSRDMTLQHGIERSLRQLVPEVKSVVADD